jgi:hypothetical protein
MAEFHDWDGIRAELDDGDSDALAAERTWTEAWISDFHLAEGRKRIGLTQCQQMGASVNRAERLRDLQAANDRRLAERNVHAEDLAGLIEACKE